MSAPEVNILLSSAGRRNYLVEWFQRALTASGHTGSVNATDADATAPALVPADRVAMLPPFTSDEYEPALLALCDAWDIQLVVSLNDYELSLWSSRLRPEFAQRQVAAAGVSARVQASLEDKLAYEALFGAAGVATPPTVTARAALAETGLLDSWGDFAVLKNRFGSGSAGLSIVPAEKLESAVAGAVASARYRDGTICTDPDEALDLLVVQPRLIGPEVGLDVVNDFRAAHRGTLARRKISMRSGETDKAESLDSAAYSALAERISTAVGHHGLIDVDVIVTESSSYVIDVNPRFGGGYPFSHAAGADVPACYIAWIAGAPIEPHWLQCRPGVTSAKFEQVTIVRGDLP